jgi:hypothetical protein
VSIFFIEESLSFDCIVPALIFTTISFGASINPEFTFRQPPPGSLLQFSHLTGPSLPDLRSRQCPDRPWPITRP